MGAVFLKIVNMSITASWLIMAVILVRLLLKKAPKWISCVLWALVAIRLIIPFSFESALSLIPSSETIPVNIAEQHEPAITSGISIVNQVVNPVIAESFTPAPTDSANPLQILIPTLAIIWIAGIVIMLAYALISYLKLKKIVAVCVPVEERLLSCDDIKAPFILGVFRPSIYVPSSMNGKTLEHVIHHEKAHLQRHDHWWKPLGFLLLSVYWFNPLCWIAYILLCRDIEMACDEKVIRDMKKDDMAAYSQALLDCSFPRKKITACPLAFGEVGVKERIKGVLNYKKPSFWIILASILVCIVLAVCLLTNPKSSPYKDLDAAQIASATVRLSPPDKTVQIIEIEELVEYLKDVVIHNEDNSYTEYEGQGVTFTLTMTDGTQTRITAFNPFLVIDGVGYKTDYKPCEALNNYANELLNAENANIILEEPPALAFVSDNTNMGALLGTYSWQKMNSDGTSTATEADSAHPLDCKDLLLPYETTEVTATLRFTESPDRILSVRCWSDEHWADPTANSENVIVRGNVIELKPGGYIYEVKAEWDADNGYGGTANYYLYLTTIE